MRIRFKLKFEGLFDKFTKEFEEYSNYVFFYQGNVIAVSNHLIVRVPFSKLFWCTTDEIDRTKSLLNKFCIKAKDFDKLLKSKNEIDIILKSESDDEDAPQALHFIDTITKETFKLEPYTITQNGEEKKTNILDVPSFNKVIENFETQPEATDFTPKIILSLELVSGITKFVSQEEDKLKKFILHKYSLIPSQERINLTFIITTAAKDEKIIEIYCAYNQ